MARSSTAAKSRNESQVPAPRQSAGALAEQMPDFMKGKAGRGVENINASDVEIPRVKLLQAISPEVMEKDGKAGEFWHTIAEKSMGKSLLMVPIYTDQRFILWRPQHDGGGILARSDDGVHWSPARGQFTIRPYKDDKKKSVVWTLASTVRESGLAEWGSYDPDDDQSQPAATRMFNIVAAFPDFPQLSPAVISLQRSSIKVGRKLMAKLKLADAPAYGTVFEMSSVIDTNADNQDFFNFAFAGRGFVSDPQQFKAYEDLCTRFEKDGVQIKDVEGLQDEDRPDSRGGGGGDGKDF